MQAVVLLIVLLVVVFLLVRSVQDARARAAGGPQAVQHEPAPAPRRPRRPTRSRRQPGPKKKIDEQALAEHVTKLRQAIEADLISFDEGAASVVRHTDGALSEEAARKLLESDEAA